MRFKKTVFILAGTLSLAAGCIGILVPVLPTTPFVLLSAFFYLRSSASLYRKLTGHRLFGRIIRDYFTNGTVDRRVRRASLAFLWLSLGISALLVRNTHIRLFLVLIGAGVSIHLLLLKSPDSRSGKTSEKEKPEKYAMTRKFNYDIMPEIKERWSARALSSEKIAKEDILALLEAARYAPSCFNEQPWRFLVADDEETLAKMRGILTPKNRRWADRAPVLILIASVKTFEYDGSKNYWNMFDTGTAWGYLSLEAQRRGLIAHAMGGFDREKARSVFGLADSLNIITVAAVGRYGNKGDLPDDLREQEFPQTREEIEDLLLNGNGG